MTAEEKQALKEAKRDVSEELASLDIASYGLCDIDERIEIYAIDVANNPDAHNLYEQLAVRRFFRLIDKYGLDGSEILQFFYFYEHLYFPGKQGMSNYKLTPVQAFQFANIYGFKRPDGKRLTREVVLYVPRKFSKTTSTASIAVYDLLYGDSNGEAYVGANSQDQARKCFDVIRGCMRRLDPDGRRYVVNKELVASKRKDRSAFAQCLTANARTKDGLNASVVIMDEFSQARDNTLLTVLTTSMGVRDNPLTVIITTASDVFEGPFYSMLDGYKRVLLGKYEDDSLFAHIFEPDIDDPEDSEETWCKVHPHLGVTVSLDFYRQEYRKAKRDGAEAMLAFRTKLLNIYCDNEMRSWIGSDLARSMMRPFDPMKLRPDMGAQGMVAIDLSVRDDFSAVTFGVYDESSLSFWFHTKYFFPRGALPGHANEKLYRKWATDGHLTLLDGDVIDYNAIVEYILSLTQHATVLKIGYDAYKSGDVVNMLRNSLADRGADWASVLRSVPQTYGNFTSPVETFEHGAHRGYIRIDDNPINAYCFGNAVLDVDKMDNKKPIKRRQTQKIDGVITMLMCLRMFIDQTT